jgi:chromosome segregation ATPase
MEKTCDFCKKEFSTVSNLRAHQKTSKKCISERIIDSKIVSFECDFCNKSFPQKKNLQRHLETCKKKEIKEVINEVKLNISQISESDEINRLKEELRKVKEEYENVKKNIDDLKDENKRLNSNINVLTYENQIKDEKLKMKD